MQDMMGGGTGTNLFDILVNLAFGFIGGLMLFLGPKEVIDWGSKIVTDMMGQRTGAMGLATFAPYVVLAPIGGLVVKQLTNVRSLKSFAFFAVAVIVGLAAAYFSQDYFQTLM